MGRKHEQQGFIVRSPCLHNVSHPDTVRNMRALIIYHTNTGHTLRAAQDISQGLEDEGVEVTIQAVGEMSGWGAVDQSIVVVGSPCHAGSIAVRAGVSGPIHSALKMLEPSMLAGKMAGAFSVNFAYGGQRTVRAIEDSLRSAGAHVRHEGVVVKAGVPLSLFRGPKASKESCEELREFGRALARAALDACQETE